MLIPTHSNSLLVIACIRKDERHRIIAEVECCLSLIREVEAYVDINLQRSERLRQSTLALAFHPEIGNACV